MANFQHTYLHMSKMADATVEPWDPKVYDEIFSAVLALAFSESDLRAPVSAQLSASDATVTTAGACTCDTTVPLAEHLYKLTEKRG